MTEAKHTPGRMVVRRTGYTGRASAKYVITPEDNSRAIAHIKHSTVSPVDANAARLALCWNTHDSLVEALQDMLLWLDDGNRILSDSCAADVAKARAALALARGEA